MGWAVAAAGALALRGAMAQPAEEGIEAPNLNLVQADACSPDASQSQNGTGSDGVAAAHRFAPLHASMQLGARPVALWAILLCLLMSVAILVSLTAAFAAVPSAECCELALSRSAQNARVTLVGAAMFSIGALSALDHPIKQ